MPETTTWNARRWSARILRWAYVVVPLTVSVAVSATLSRLLPHERLGTLGLLAVVLSVSTAALVLTHRLTRRVLPLAALLEVSVQFPGSAPSRFAVARDAGNPERLRGIVERAQSGAPVHTGTDTEAAREILALVAALRSHDRRTRGHSERVRVFTDLVSDELDLPAGDRERLRWAALLHDVGKLSVDAAILNKPSKLSMREWDDVRAHPLAGDRLIAPLAGWLGPWARAVAEHHERWDGTGYPAGLAGEEISLAGRVVAVSDSFETMTAARSYKRAMSREAALRELTASAGTHFDPRVVRAFLTVGAPRLRWAMGPVSWVASWPVIAAAPAPATVMIQAGAGALALGATATGVVLAPVIATLGAVSVAEASASAPADRPTGPTSTSPVSEGDSADGVLDTGARITVPASDATVPVVAAAALAQAVVDPELAAAQVAAGTAPASDPAATEARSPAALASSPGTGAPSGSGVPAGSSAGAPTPSSGNNAAPAPAPAPAPASKPAPAPKPEPAKAPQPATGGQGGDGDQDDDDDNNDNDNNDNDNDDDDDDDDD